MSENQKAFRDLRDVIIKAHNSHVVLRGVTPTRLKIGSMVALDLKHGTRAEIGDDLASRIAAAPGDVRAMDGGRFLGMTLMVGGCEPDAVSVE